MQSNLLLLQLFSSKLRRSIVFSVCTKGAFVRPINLAWILIWRQNWQQILAISAQNSKTGAVEQRHLHLSYQYAHIFPFKLNAVLVTRFIRFCDHYKFVHSHYQLWACEKYNTFVYFFESHLSNLLKFFIATNSSQHSYPCLLLMV